MARSAKTPSLKREPLTRDRVLQAAVELADRRGYEALTIRNLADPLGVVPMAIYKHVTDKEDLLDGMLDRVFAEFAFPSGVGWRIAMRARAIAIREALQRHPWAIGRLDTGTPGLASITHHNALLTCLRGEAGFSSRDAIHAKSVLNSYIYGFAVQEQSHASDLTTEIQRRLAAAAQRDPDFELKHPYIVDFVEEIRSGFDADQEFDFGLDLILDELERLRVDGGRSRRGMPLRSDNGRVARGRRR